MNDSAGFFGRVAGLSEQVREAEGLLEEGGVGDLVRHLVARVPSFPANTKKVSSSYSGEGCRPAGQAAQWCYDN